MGYYAKLIHGSHEIDLTVAPFALASNYQPPAMTTDVQMSVGTAQNKSGGREIQRTPRDRRFDLPLRIEGASAAETHGAVRRVVDFIQRGLADKSEKLYFVYGPSDAVPYEPRWGQQFLYYEIKSISDPDLTRLYNIAELRSKTFFISIPLTIGPYALGKRQSIGSATGGVIERTWATPDGKSRGLGILTGSTNEVANPVFGNATYDTGYTVGAGAIKAENKDKKYILFGDTSAEVTAIDTSNNHFYTSVNIAASGAVMGYVVKKPDGSAVTSADAALVYGATALTEKFLSLGDGWYIVYANETGSGAAANFYLYPTAYTTLYVGCVFAEVGTFPKVPNYGDLLDTAWVGTAHNSDSTRTAGRLRFAATDLLDYSAGTISFRWIAGVSSDVTSLLVFLDATGGNEFVFYFDHTTNQFVFNVNAGTSIGSAAKTFALGEVMIFHLVWEPGRTEMYLNGASIAGGSAYTIPTYGDYLYIGNDDGGSYPTNGYYSDLISYDVALSDAEVLAHYNDMTEHTSGGDGLGQALMPIPWLWADDGDKVADSCWDDDYSNMMIIGGVPGDTDAHTHMILESYQSTVDDSQTGALYVNQVLLDEYIDPNDYAFGDQSGTADAAYCGGEYEIVSVGAALFADMTLFVSGRAANAMKGKRIKSVLGRVYDANPTACKTKATFGVASSGAVTTFVQLFSEEKSVTTSSSIVNLLSTHQLSTIDRNLIQDVSYDFYISWGIKRASGTNNMRYDFMHVCYDRLLYISNRYEDNAASTITEYDSDQPLATDISGSKIWSFPLLEGDTIEMAPRKMNVLFFYPLYNNGHHIVNTPAVPTTTATIYVTPRWSLL